MSAYPVVWTATDGTITSSGTYTAPLTPRSAAGINARAGDALGNVTLSIRAPTVRILTPTSVVRAGASLQITLSLSYNGQAVTDVPVKWAVYPPQLGTVSATGLLTAASSAADYSVGYVCAFAGNSVAQYCNAGPNGEGIAGYQFSILNR
jgi:hypothetical protein